MKIVNASSEAIPFAKTGGLADVASGLSKALSAAGNDVTLILPYYRRVTPQHLVGDSLGQITVKVGEKNADATLFAGRMPGSSLRVILIDKPDYFDRGALYTEKGHDYHDNCERFVFFSRAVLEAARTLDLKPDVFHAHDWQTGLIPALVRTEWRKQPGCEQTAAVYTIHNMAFQGKFPWWDMRLTGMSWEYFTWQQMEYYGDLNLMKTGIVFSDITTTVSPTYAKEICRPDYGYGLDSVLSLRGNRLVGILNGVDTDEWNPETDKYLPVKYTLSNFAEGKAACKKALQQEFGLPQRAEAMVFGMVSRLTDQKGLDLIIAKAEELLKADIQLFFLGTGDVRTENALHELAHRFAQKVGVRIGFDEGLAHRIEAGADAYLMPSRFEPCGLNQMYSMAYGTPPIVMNVGGLADSVTDTTAETLMNGTATGFKFTTYTPEAFLSAVWKCVGCFLHDRVGWSKLVENGMTRDWSWKRGAADFTQAYQRAMQFSAK